jgi:hypothetical protein
MIEQSGLGACGRNRRRRFLLRRRRFLLKRKSL